MGQDSALQILWLDQVDSTQRYLKDALKSGKLQSPVCVATSRQFDGKGSRANQWIGMDGNLFFSFSVTFDMLPQDLKHESASIYFMYLLKEILMMQSSKVWLKWPNDFYVDNKKIAGCITNIQGKSLICGIGLNAVKAPEGSGILDIACDYHDLLVAFMRAIEKKQPWKHVFRNYKLEFEQNKTRILLAGTCNMSDAVMMDDGSLMCHGQRIYSQR